MAQVEFVAVFLILLRQHRIDAVSLDGETKEQTNRELDSRTRDSLSILTLQMNHIYDVPAGSDKGLRLRLSRR